MKKNLFIGLLLLSSSFLFAQENNDITPSYNNEWGINITAFANQFLSFNGNEANEGSYLFTYKNIKGVQAFRLGAGLFIDHSKTDGGTNTAPLSSDVVDFDLRIGFEKQYELGRWWLFTAGGDFIIGINHVSSESDSNFGNVKIKDTEWSAGLGPVLGIHFRFSPRVSIGTEGTIYFRYFNSKSKTDFGVSGGNEKVEKTDGVNLAMSTPLALYFAIRI